MGTDPDGVEIPYMTEHCCASCEDQLFLTDEVVLLQVVYANFTGTQIECYDIDDGVGGFIYEPYFLHIDCWEELIEGLGELTEDCPPLLDPMSIFDCSHCKSGIRSWESSCLVTPGELRRSPRSPTGVQNVHFDACLGEPKLLCISCIAQMTEEVVEMWDDLSHHGECPEGTHRRCWRGNECHDLECPCPRLDAH